MIVKLVNNYLIFSKQNSYSVRDVARLATKITKRTEKSEKDRIYRIKGSSKLPAFVICGSLRFQAKDVLNYLGISGADFSASTYKEYKINVSKYMF